MPFAALGVCPPLIAALNHAGLTAPTPVQEQVLPAVLAGRDVQVQAPTGSGKTLAYVLPLLQQLIGDGQRGSRTVRQLVLVPTRELAEQVAGVFTEYGRGLPRPPKVVVAIGGVSINPQMLALRGGADVLVATPGRLLDLLDHNALLLDGVHALVLDEADRLLDLGFGEQMQQLLRLLPRSRQTLLFSATFPEDTSALARTSLREPLQVQLDAPGQAPAIVQRVICVDEHRRNPLLQHLAREEGWEQVLVFVASQRSSENLAQKLAKAGFEAEALHGDLGQGRRSRVLQGFAEGRVKWLVATDVAARGIDIAGLPLVINYDLPRSTEDYLHRIGRSGRAGAQGMAISLLTEANQAHLRLIEKRHRLQLPREVVAGFEPRAAAPTAAGTPAAVADNGGIKGKRPSKKDRLRAAQAAGK
ncbi:DEAD/DEAH box helicase [Stenotrophomonas sp. W1S232]|uniref:DEAD/DEAH box helicase n=1 Tax=Stenotrophomonas koreensis TaxID=266128 RepID=A0A7W3UXK4_9GAMM|nr:DEAD/DEAH box helicase [Stenotrophomonas koreensis]MBB1115719.1 DEAD/DEAH box helicase [Stenotrophomonas koreensis]